MKRKVSRNVMIAITAAAMTMSACAQAVVAEEAAEE